MAGANRCLLFLAAVITACEGIPKREKRRLGAPRSIRGFVRVPGYCEILRLPAWLSRRRRVKRDDVVSATTRR